MSEVPAIRAVVRGPVRNTDEAAQGDFDRILYLLLKHAPDLAPPGYKLAPAKPIPGSHTWSEK
jgi:hypothetical protein